jgi:selenide, water dikinase
VQTASTAPIVKDIVLIGGGHAHVHVLKSFGMQPIPGVRLTLVTRDVETPYSGMLPGFISGFYSFEETHVDLRPLARFAGARLLHDAVHGIDPVERRVLMDSHPPLAYDLLSIDIGSTPRADGIPGARDHAIPVKPISHLSARWAALLERVRAAGGKPGAPRRFVTVGAGAAGVEVTLAARHRLCGILKSELGGDPDTLSFTILSRGDLLAEHNGSVRNRFRRILAEQGVRLVTGVTVNEVSQARISTSDGQGFDFDEAFWVTEAGAAPWLQQTGLSLDQRGFISIDDSLRSVSHQDVFAVGDIASNATRPLPKAGVFAVRQGKALSENLRRAVTGEALLPYRPQQHFLSLISSGDRYAVASRGRWAAEGAALWRLKDTIDRRWLRLYQELPEMTPVETAPQATAADPLAVLAPAPMRCGGCGAKVGKDSLARVLQRLAPKHNDSLLVGLDAADDAAILVPPSGNRVLVQTVDFFRSFIDDPYLFGRIAANHALGDIYAMGGTPLSALAIATVPHAAEDKMEEDLFQILRGGLDVLENAGAVLAGGHSAEGAELALGFTINGSVSLDKILRKGGAKAGDALILTKPLGTGALLAAEMHGQARAGWIEAALESMQVSQSAAAGIFLDHGASACTDVTGFGLVGHLHEMATAAGLDAELRLDGVPALSGALAVLGRGIASSLAPDNLRLRRAIDADARTLADPRFALLFDPQTAGGLLAAVPAERAAACVAALRMSSYAAACVIGAVSPRSGTEARIAIVG